MNNQFDSALDERIGDTEFSFLVFNRSAGNSQEIKNKCVFLMKALVYKIN